MWAYSGLMRSLQFHCGRGAGGGRTEGRVFWWGAWHLADRLSRPPTVAEPSLGPPSSGHSSQSGAHLWTRVGGWGSPPHLLTSTSTTKPFQPTGLLTHPRPPHPPLPTHHVPIPEVHPPVLEHQ